MMQRIRLLFSWFARRQQALDGIRCGFCEELFVGPTKDCACTNWGGFIGI